MKPRFDHMLQQAIDEGILPPNVDLTPEETRPWPVVLLIGLGAWLTAIPMLVLIGILFGGLLSHAPGMYAIGALLMALAYMILRAPHAPLFVEQLAIPALLIGEGCFGFALFHALPYQLAAATLALVTLVMAFILDRPWLRVLLGVGAALLTLMALTFTHSSSIFFAASDSAAPWWALHGVVLIWLAGFFGQKELLKRNEHASWVQTLESVNAGWAMASLLALAWLSGMSFLVGGSVGGVGSLSGELMHFLSARPLSPEFVRQASISGLLALAAASMLLRAWPSLRQPWVGGLALISVMLAALMPTLGAVLLILAAMLHTHRWRLAAAAGVAAAWILGSFYYALHWPLAQKSFWFMLFGALLGALAWWARRSGALASVSSPSEPMAIVPHERRSDWIVLCAVAVLTMLNLAIWQKQTLIAEGEPVFVELAPLDPRSLMQGDYMRLNFRLPPDARAKLDALLTVERPKLVARRDERGVATLLRLADPRFEDLRALPDGEFPIELSPKNGRWVLVTDAWFFKEGEAAHWSRAKYGEFRVNSQGQALLVGMADGELRALERLK